MDDKIIGAVGRQGCAHEVSDHSKNHEIVLMEFKIVVHEIGLKNHKKKVHKSDSNRY